MSLNRVLLQSTWLDCSIINPKPTPAITNQFTVPSGYTNFTTMEPFLYSLEFSFEREPEDGFARPDLACVDPTTPRDLREGAELFNWSNDEDLNNLNEVFSFDAADASLPSHIAPYNEHPFEQEGELTNSEDLILPWDNTSHHDPISVCDLPFSASTANSSLCADLTTAKSTSSWSSYNPFYMPEDSSLIQLSEMDKSPSQGLEANLPVLMDVPISTTSPSNGAGSFLLDSQLGLSLDSQQWLGSTLMPSTSRNTELGVKFGSHHITTWLKSPQSSESSGSQDHASTHVPQFDARVTKQNAESKRRPKRVQCEFCNSSWDCKRDKDRHCVSKHPLEAKRKMGIEAVIFPCSHCRRTFTRRDNKLRHMRNKHGL